MSKRHIFLFIVAGFLYNKNLFSDAILSFFFKPYPIQANAQFCQQLTTELTRPGTLAHYCSYGLLDKRLVMGIFATYGGYLNISDELGYISFPLQHQAPFVNILITNKIVPVIIAGNTVLNWEVEDPKQAAMFLLERKVDSSTKLSYWKTSERSIPENKRLPLETVIIFAKPHQIYVPLGITIMPEQVNLTLPDVYVKKGFNDIAHALYMLNLKHLFAPVRYSDKLEPSRVIRQVITQ